MKSLLSILLLFIMSINIVNAKVNCEQFRSWYAAKQYYNAQKADYELLDRNHNGDPCEHLKKGASIKKMAQIRIFQYGSPAGIGQRFTSINNCKKEQVKLTKSHIGTDYSYKCVEL